MIFTALKNRCMLHGRVFVMSYNAEGQAMWPLVLFVVVTAVDVSFVAVLTFCVCK